MAEAMFLGLDLGSTNAKAACYDAQGGLQATSSQPYETSYPRHGWYEQRPQDWLEALERALKDVVLQLGSRTNEIAGMALSAHGPGLVMVDAEGEPLAPSPTWQDVRCKPQGQRLLEAVGPGWIGQGVPLAGFPAKVLWAKDEQPELLARAQQLFDVKGFLIHGLTGMAATDRSSGPGAEDWYEPAFDFIGWPVARLPRVAKATDQVGALLEDPARRFGLPPGVPVFAGLNDGAAATLGCGVGRLGESAISLATNGVARLVVADRLDFPLILDRSLFCWPYVDGLWVCGGFTLSGAGSLQWLAELLDVSRKDEAIQSLLDEAAEAPVGSGGVVFLPYLAGRGSPAADPSQRGAFLHLGLEHGRGEMARAVIEGVAFALSEVYAEFARLGFKVDDIHVTGGGARSGLWRQVLADVLRRRIFYAGGDGTLGSAMVAAVGLGVHADFEAAMRHMVHPLAQCEPDEAHARQYQVGLKAFARGRDAVSRAGQPESRDGC